MSVMLERLPATERAFEADLIKFEADKTRVQLVTPGAYSETAPSNYWLSHGSEYPLLKDLADLVFAVPLVSFIIHFHCRLAL